MIIVDAGGTCAFCVHQEGIFNGGVGITGVDIPEQGGFPEGVAANIIGEGYQSIELILHKADCKHFAELVFDFPEIVHQEAVSYTHLTLPTIYSV